MVLGVALAAVLYATLDIQPFWRRWMSTQILRKAIIGVFATRMIVSVIFPIGMMNDGMCGLFSMPAVGYVGQVLGASDMSPFQAFATTVLQGTVLSLELYLLGLIYVGILKLWDAHAAKKKSAL